MLFFVAIKKAILNLRLRPDVRDEFAIAAELRGASMSGLLHQFIVRTIREEKELSPQAFKDAKQSNEPPRSADAIGVTREKSETVVLKSKPLEPRNEKSERDSSEVRKPRKRAGK